MQTILHDPLPHKKQLFINFSNKSNILQIYTHTENHFLLVGSVINVKLQTDARILSLHEFAFYISLSETELAFGLASAGSNLKIYQISGDCKTLSLIKTFKLSGAVTDLAYSLTGPT